MRRSGPFVTVVHTSRVVDAIYEVLPIISWLVHHGLSSGSLDPEFRVECCLCEAPRPSIQKTSQYSTDIPERQKKSVRKQRTHTRIPEADL